MHPHINTHTLTLSSVSFTLPLFPTPKLHCVPYLEPHCILLPPTIHPIISSGRQPPYVTTPEVWFPHTAHITNEETANPILA